MDDQLLVGGLQRTIPGSNRLEIFHVRFFLISDILYWELVYLPEPIGPTVKKINLNKYIHIPSLILVYT
jgi:hypothetical protein